MAPGRSGVVKAWSRWWGRENVKPVEPQKRGAVDAWSRESVEPRMRGAVKAWGAADA